MKTEMAAEIKAQQEPVAKYIGECSEGSLVHLYDDVKKGTNFYTAPPQRPWVDLTNEEIQVIAKKARSKDHAVTLTNKFLRDKNT